MLFRPSPHDITSLSGTGFFLIHQCFALFSVFQMLSYHATCSKVEVDRLKVILRTNQIKTLYNA